jgi:2-polyprenyl-3-methyl-5-hydroxy-6-metoxy-1,4-benzoquinol methylase
MRDQREHQGPEYWDTLARSWEDEIFNTLANDRHGVIRGELTRVADRSASVADFGCGVGVYLPLLSGLFGEVHGFEQSGACVERCRRLARALDNVTLHNVATVPRGMRGRFDVVLCVNVALHPQRWYGVLRSAVSLM